MKTVLTLIFALCFSLVSIAQAPDRFSYQSVVRDANNDLVSNAPVGLQISILQGSATGTAVFVETHNPSSNDNGLISIQIGGGSNVSGSITSIDWTQGPYFIKTDIDPNGGTNYTVSGTSQLLSVPYAKRASSAETVTGPITENDPVFSGSIAAGISSGDTASWNAKLDTEVDGSVSNEIQTISRSGTTVTLSNGGGNYTDSVGQYTAGSGVNISNQNVISADINTILPAGMVVPYAGDTSNIPNGWLLCDGSEISRSTFANLFANIGIAWGTGDGVATFNLPDFRGRFLRGQALGQTTDPDRGTRFGLNGGNSGDNVGSYQTDNFSTHSHGINDPGHAHSYVDRYRLTTVSDNANDRGVASNALTSGTYGTSVSGTNISIQNSGGSETRPENAYVNYIIKH